MLTVSTRQYLCRIEGLYDQNNIPFFCYRTVSDSWKCLQAPVKITGIGLAAGCQLFYCKINEYFCSACFLWNTGKIFPKLSLLLLLIFKSTFGKLAFKVYENTSIQHVFWDFHQADPFRNFLFAFLNSIVFPKCVYMYYYRKDISPMGTISFLIRFNPRWEGRQE